jgi:hypothetical protein
MQTNKNKAFKMTNQEKEDLEDEYEYDNFEELIQHLHFQKSFGLNVARNEDLYDEDDDSID